MSDMNHFQTAGNPFEMMLAPEAIISRMERSTQLRTLRKRVLRPLDAPWILRTVRKNEAARAADEAIEREFARDSGQRLSA